MKQIANSWSKILFAVYYFLQSFHTLAQCKIDPNLGKLENAFSDFQRYSVSSKARYSVYKQKPMFF